ncbi:Anaphase-promoting complex subunit 4 WD40 domain-containing protein [Frankia sp. AiPs1]|uniref:WD40 repeat domain-containing protein n=1 Tax=Frankia sp. AiPa1 TaxID=573492 RepID=UPI00202AF1C8|nr:WD40 repeat domain-containing protein [Frankia sp. AiPa1]MCL9758654.1 WD40 repeat domain-containing protein [Frankia sp. AiPa1]
MPSGARAGRGSIAGSSGDGGVEFRRAVAAYAVVAGLSDTPLRGLGISRADARVTAVVLETEDAVDDLRVDFATGETAYIQAKRTLQGGPVLAKAVAQWVRAGEGQLDPTRHRLVIATGDLSNSMKALRRALDARRLSVPGTPSPEEAEQLRRVEELMSPLDPAARDIVLQCAVIWHLDVEETDRADAQTALQQLRGLVAGGDALAAGKAWSALLDAAGHAARRRGGHHLEGWRTAMRDRGIGLVEHSSAPAQSGSQSNPARQSSHPIGDHDLRERLTLQPPVRAPRLRGSLASATRPRRTRRLWGAALAAVLMMVAGTAVYSLNDRQASGRNLADSRQLAADAESTRDSNPSLARQLAVLAWRTAPTLEAWRALFAVADLPTEVDLDDQVLAVGRVGGRFVAVTALSTKAQLWDVTRVSGKAGPLAVLSGHDRITAAVFSPDGRRLATMAVDGSVLVWNVESATAGPPGNNPVELTALASLPGNDSASPAMAFSSDGTLLAVPGPEGSVEVWNTRLSAGSASAQNSTGPDPEALPLQIPGVVSGIDDPGVSALAFTPDGGRLAVGTSGGTFAVFALGRPAEPLMRRTNYAGAMNADAVEGTAGQTTPPDTLETSHLPPQRQPVTRLLFRPDDGATLAVAGGDGVVRLWDVAGTDPTLASQNAPVNLPTKPTAELGDGAPAVDAIAYSTDGLHLAVGFGVSGGTVDVWDVTDESSPAQGAPIERLNGSPISLTFDRAGQTLAVGTADGAVRLSPVASPGMPQPRLTVPDIFGDYVAVDGAGTTVAVSLAVDGVDGTIEIRDLRAGSSEPTVTFPGREATVYSIAISPDGALLAAGYDDGVVRVWDLRAALSTRAAASPVADLAEHGAIVQGLAFTSDGRLLASGDQDGTIKLFRLDGTHPPKRIAEAASTHGSVQGITFSADNGTLVTGGDSGVGVYDVPDVSTGGLLTTVADISDATAGNLSGGVALSPDGRTLAVGGHGTVTTWDITGPTPQQQGTPLPVGSKEAAVSTVDFSPDGRLLAAAGNDGDIAIWDTSRPGQPKSLTSLPGHDNGTRLAAFTDDSRTLVTLGSDYLAKQ